MLSPAFDLNPSPDLSQPRITSILGVVDYEAELPALKELAASYRLSDEAANDILVEITDALANWRDIAEENGIVKKEIDQFAPVFEPRSPRR